jgi:hypothetical protein
VDELSAAFYAELDKLSEACDAKSAETLKSGYLAAVSKFDVVLKELGLPVVAEADTSRIQTP